MHERRGCVQIRWKIREYVFANCMERPELCMHYEVCTALWGCVCVHHQHHRVS